MKEKLVDGSKLFFIDYNTKKEEYAIYNYGYVTFKNGNQISISNYDSNLHYIFNRQYDVIRIENPKEFEIIEPIEEDKEIEKMPMIYNGDERDEIMRNRYKINGLIDEINKLKKGEINK